jgi:arginase
MTPRTEKVIKAIGIPMDLGQKHRGVDMGPSGLRYAGLGEAVTRLGYTFCDAGNIDVPLRYTLADCGSKALLAAIASACTEICTVARTSIEDGELPVFLGGDHSLAVGTISGVCSAAQTGVIWIDAHGDCNTPQSSTTHNIHGMVLASLLGQGFPELVRIGGSGATLSPNQVVLIGIRDLDPKEKGILKDIGCRVYTMRDIDERGMNAVISEALARLSGFPNLHVSLDLDVLDPDLAPGVGTRAAGGLTYREAQLLMEIIADCGSLSSIDLVEINPILDRQNRTATVAVELLASLLGKSIL